MSKRKRRPTIVYDDSKKFIGNHIQDNSATITNCGKTKIQSQNTDAFNRDSYNNNHNITINFFNCNNPEKILNTILPVLNSISRKRPLSEVVHGIDEFNSNKRLKTARSGGITAGKYMPNNYFENEGWQNNKSNHNNNNCHRSSNLLNVLKNGSPINYKNNITIDHDINPSPWPNDFVDGTDGWFAIDKTKTHPIHPYYDCTSTSTNNFSSSEIENKQLNESPSPSQPIARVTRSRKNLENVDISTNRLGRKKKKKQENKNQSKSKPVKTPKKRRVSRITRSNKHLENQSLETIIEKNKLERDKIKKSKKKKKENLISNHIPVLY